MRIVIMTSGSRGDVQPYIALALGLQRAGYQVDMLTHRVFAPMIEQHGLAFTPLTGNPRAMLESNEGQNFLAAGGNVLRFAHEMAEARKGQEAEETTSIVLQALERSKQRGIIATGWGGLSNANLPGSVFQLEEAPHDWLFPRMAAVVHHAGSGTTAAGLRAGVPSIFVPFFADQPFWAERVYRLGVATRPIPRQCLTAENLAAAITSAVSDSAMRARAADLGARIRAEDGVGKAVQVVQQVLAPCIS